MPRRPTFVSCPSEQDYRALNAMRWQLYYEDKAYELALQALRSVPLA